MSNHMTAEEEIRILKQEIDFCRQSIAEHEAKAQELYGSINKLEYQLLELYPALYGCEVGDKASATAGWLDSKRANKLLAVIYYSMKPGDVLTLVGMEEDGTARMTHGDRAGHYTASLYDYSNMRRAWLEGEGNQ